MGSLDEQKKLLLPFLQRAGEVEKAEPKIAYYCRLYAVEQALQIPTAERAPEITGLLGALLAKLEKDRGVLQLTKDDNLYCENFALTVFGRADRVDRAGRADKNTAITFYAASYFMEILNQFGELPADLAAKQRYAAWRAAEINKAIKEGRAPPPPPAPRAATLSDEDQQLMDSLGGGAADLGPSASGTLPPPAPRLEPAGSGHAADQLPPPPPPLHPPPPRAQEEEEGGLSLPSPPKAPAGVERQLSARGSAWVAPPPRTFFPFQKVLFFDGSSPAPQRGTIAKAEAAPEGSPAAAGAGATTYYVALKGTPKHPEEKWLYRIVPTDATHLSPELSKGDRAEYLGQDGQSVGATIEQVDASHWPPSYLIRTDAGSWVETIDDRLTPLNPDLQSPDEELARLTLQQAQQQQLGGTAAAAAAAAAAPPPQHEAESPPYPPGSAHAQPPPAPPPAAAYPPPGAFASSSNGGSGFMTSSSSAGMPSPAGPPPPPPGAAAYPPPPPAAPQQPPRPPPASARAPLYPPAAPPGGAASPQRAPAGRHVAPPALSPAAAHQAAAAAAAPPAAAVALPRSAPGFKPGLQELADAQKLAKTAISALSFEDVPTAVKNLTDAIRLLTQPR